MNTSATRAVGDYAELIVHDLGTLDQNIRATSGTRLDVYSGANRWLAASNVVEVTIRQKQLKAGPQIQQRPIA
jgi:hypothetical protein